MQIALFLESEHSDKTNWKPPGNWREQPDARHSLRGQASGVFLGYKSQEEDWHALDAFARQAFAEFPDTILFVQWEIPGTAQLMNRLDFQSLRGERWKSVSTRPQEDKITQKI